MSQRAQSHLLSALIKIIRKANVRDSDICFVGTIVQWNLLEIIFK